MAHTSKRLTNEAASIQFFRKSEINLRKSSIGALGPNLRDGFHINNFKVAECYFCSVLNVGLDTLCIFAGYVERWMGSHSSVKRLVPRDVKLASRFTQRYTSWCSEHRILKKECLAHSI
mmetsp:Transcript_29062/g.46775  ORF Transcript_29062/g.46775 Transcript_29062/m.46775 type:complete len:119 (+) Transcript_29062:176-532(+)